MMIFINYEMKYTKNKTKLNHFVKRQYNHQNNQQSTTNISIPEEGSGYFDPTKCGRVKIKLPSAMRRIPDDMIRGL